MNTTLIGALIALLFTGPPFCCAQTPTAAQIDLERARIEKERAEMFAPVTPATAPVNSFPNIATPEPSRVDIEALAARYEHKAGARKADSLFVFVSFTVPPESLKRAIADANRAGGVIVMRGFKNGSIKTTALAIKELGEAAWNIQINPNAFTKYRVSAVPAVVLVQPEGQELVDDEGCALPDKYVSVAGDVSLAYALGEIEKRSPMFQAMAARYARPLKEPR